VDNPDWILAATLIFLVFIIFLEVVNYPDWILAETLIFLVFIIFLEVVNYPDCMDSSCNTHLF
jgi:hypothetical protein